MSKKGPLLLSDTMLRVVMPNFIMLSFVVNTLSVVILSVILLIVAVPSIDPSEIYFGLPTKYRLGSKCFAVIKTL